MHAPHTLSNLHRLLQTKGGYRRRAAVLVELLSAGPALEQKLATFRGEIDEALLHMALRRLKAAQDLQQVGGKLLDNTVNGSC